MTCRPPLGRGILGREQERDVAVLVKPTHGVPLRSRHTGKALAMRKSSEASSSMLLVEDTNGRRGLTLNGGALHNVDALHLV